MCAGEGLICHVEVLEEEEPLGLSSRKSLWFFEVDEVLMICVTIACFLSSSSLFLMLLSCTVIGRSFKSHHLCFFHSILPL